MSSSKGKTTRAPNFSETEIGILLDVCGEFSQVIDCKKTDGSSIEARLEAWKDIERNFNVKSGKWHRSADKLKTCYKNILHKARKDIADEKVSIYKTGGGPPDIKVSEATALLVARIPEHFVPPQNPFDCDSSYVEKTAKANEENPTNGFMSSSPVVVRDPELLSALNLSAVEAFIGEEDPYLKPGTSYQRSPVLNIPRRKHKRVHLLHVGQLSSGKLLESQSDDPTHTKKSKSEKVQISMKKRAENERQDAMDEVPRSSQDSSSQETSSGQFVVQNQGERDRPMAKKTQKPKTNAPSRRLGSHIIASQRMSTMAQEKINYLKKLNENEDKLQEKRMEILDAQLKYEHVKLKLMKVKAGFGRFTDSD